MSKVLTVTSDKTRFYDNVTNLLWLDANRLEFVDELGNVVTVSGCPIFVTETFEVTE